MFIKQFNNAWEKERASIEKLLEEKIAEQIKGIDISMRRRDMSKEDLLVINKLRNELVLRKSMVVFESEDIARNRMQLRASYLALVLSSVALIISVSTVLFKFL